MPEFAFSGPGSPGTTMAACRVARWGCSAMTDTTTLDKPVDVADDTERLLTAVVSGATPKRLTGGR